MPTGIDNSCAPRNQPQTSASVSATRTSTSGTSAASAAFSRGTTTRRPRARAQQRRQHTGHAAQRAGQRQFAEEFAIVEFLARHLAAGGVDAQRDRHIETTAVLGQLGRRQVHGDAAAGIFERGVLDRHAHAITRLTHRRLGQADDIGARQAAGKVYLDHHLRCGDPFLGPTEGDRKTHATADRGRMADGALTGTDIERLHQQR
jgi:hypothetical protein